MRKFAVGAAALSIQCRSPVYRVIASINHWHANANSATIAAFLIRVLSSSKPEAFADRSSLLLDLSNQNFARPPMLQETGVTPESAGMISTR